MKKYETRMDVFITLKCTKDEAKKLINSQIMIKNIMKAMQLAYKPKWLKGSQMKDFRYPLKKKTIIRRTENSNKNRTDSLSNEKDPCSESNKMELESQLDKKKPSTDKINEIEGYLYLLKKLIRKEIHKDAHNKTKETIIDQIMEEETTKENIEKEVKKSQSDTIMEPTSRLPIQIRAKTINFNAPSSLSIDTNTKKNNEEKIEYEPQTKETKKKINQK